MPVALKKKYLPVAMLESYTSKRAKSASVGKKWTKVLFSLAEDMILSLIAIYAILEFKGLNASQTSLILLSGWFISMRLFFNSFETEGAQWVFIIYL